MSEMVDRVALALLEHFTTATRAFVAPDFPDHPEGPIYEGRLGVLIDGDVDLCAAARAAIAAMREPTDAMILSATGGPCVGEYQTLIDEALKP